MEGMGCGLRAEDMGWHNFSGKLAKPRLQLPAAASGLQVQLPIRMVAKEFHGTLVELGLKSNGQNY